MYQKIEIDNKYYNAVTSRESQIGYLQKLLAKVVKKSQKIGLTINCKQTECMIVNKESPTYE